MKTKVILALSGGLDSTTLLAHILAKGWEAYAVNFIYDSKHNQRERFFAKQIIKHYGIQSHRVDLSGMFNEHCSSLMRNSEKIPEGHYTDETMKSTVVPGRNMVFLSVLASIAEQYSIINFDDEECEYKVAYGAHSGDHAIYPDCRPDFLYAMNRTIMKQSENRISMYAPFMTLSKGDIVERGIELNVPFELTRTCYTDGLVACGKCGSCIERLEAFELNGVTDPIEYEVK